MSLTIKKLNILIVDDDIRLCQLLKRYLQSHGLSVFTATCANEMIYFFEHQTVDFLILDWMLPQQDGLSICKMMRQDYPYIPILMLTARNTLTDRVAALDMGADDYLAKPFEPQELLSRINAIRRRYTQQTDIPQAVVFDGITIDMHTRTIKRQDHVWHLTAIEVNLLMVFLKYPNSVLSRQRLMELAFGRDLSPKDRRIDVHISRLRKLIEKSVENPKHLKTVRGVGYMWKTDE